MTALIYFFCFFVAAIIQQILRTLLRDGVVPIIPGSVVLYVAAIWVASRWVQARKDAQDNHEAESVNRYLSQKALPSKFFQMTAQNNSSFSQQMFTDILREALQDTQNVVKRLPYEYQHLMVDAVAVRNTLEHGYVIQLPDAEQTEDCGHIGAFIINNNYRYFISVYRKSENKYTLREICENGAVLPFSDVLNSQEGFLKALSSTFGWNFERVSSFYDEKQQPASVENSNEASDRNCHNCGAELPEGSSFCSYCGAKIVRKKKCSACGREIDGNAIFCRFCGERQ